MNISPLPDDLGNSMFRFIMRLNALYETICLVARLITKILKLFATLLS